MSISEKIKAVNNKMSKRKLPTDYSSSIRRQNSMNKICQNFIDFERPIPVEILALIRRENFNVDST